MYDRIPKINNYIVKHDSVIDSTDVDSANSFIELYNNLEDGQPKLVTAEYLKLKFAKPIGDIFCVDLGEPLLDKLDEDLKNKRRNLSGIINDFLRIYKKEYLNQEYDRFVYSQFQGLLADFVQEKGLSKGEYEMFAYMIAEKDKMGELDEIENDKEREVAILMLINEVFEEFSERFNISE